MKIEEKELATILSGGGLGALAAWLMRQKQRTILFPVSGNLVVAQNVSYEIPVPFNFTCNEVYLHVKEAPTGAALIVNVYIGNSPMFNIEEHKPFIADGNFSGSTTVIDNPSFPKNSVLSVDIEQIGAVDSGADLIVEVRGSA
jgi:hypothetical protein